MRFLGFACGALCVVGTVYACGGGDETGSTARGPSTTTGSPTTTNGPGPGSGGNGQGGAAGAGPGSGGAGQGGTGTGGASMANCSAAMVSSTCQPEAVIRVAARLGNGMSQATGTLRVTLAHYKLGGGAGGGVFHTNASTPNATVSPSVQAEVHFDMCSGGEMWSQENCEFNLYGFLDQNNNTLLDSGEPAGRLLVNVSCMNNGAHCFELVLDCTTGTSCIGFTDPGGGCQCQMPTCNSAIVTCT